MVRLEDYKPMLSYSFGDIGSDSLYEHLYKCIRRDITAGILTVHEKLPPKRPFAKELGISVITVENAYAQLIAEGYIYSIPKKGFFVADIHTSVMEHKAVLTEDNVRLSSGKNSYFADFTDNRTEASNFPFSVWAKLTREVLSENQAELLTSPPCGGIFELREAIAKHLHGFCNMNVTPEQIIIGAGTEYLYGLLIQLLGFDKIYAVENPGYQKISNIYKSHHVSCEYLSMDECGVKIDEAERKNADILHISPSHHFPTGMIVPVGRRYELLGWAARSEHRYIIEDEYDSEFRFTGKLIPTMQSIDVLEKVIYMNTFSKTLASTIRISYMVLPKHLANRFYSELSFYSCTVSTFEQYTLAKFINDGYFEKHLNRMRNHYRDKRDAVVRSITESPLGQISEIKEANSGLHFILKIETELSDEQVCKNAEDNGIKLSALSNYYIGDHDADTPAHSFLINYSSLPDGLRNEAIKRIFLSLKR